MISKWTTFRSENTFLHDKTRWMIIDRVKGPDVDRLIDLFVAESLRRAGFHKSDHISDRLAERLTSMTVR